MLNKRTNYSIVKKSLESITLTLFSCWSIKFYGNKKVRNLLSGTWTYSKYSWIDFDHSIHKTMRCYTFMFTPKCEYIRVFKLARLTIIPKHLYIKNNPISQVRVIIHNLFDNLANLVEFYLAIYILVFTSCLRKL